MFLCSCLWLRIEWVCNPDTIWFKVIAYLIVMAGCCGRIVCIVFFLIFWYLTCTVLCILHLRLGRIHGVFLFSEFPFIYAWQDFFLPLRRDIYCASTAEMISRSSKKCHWNFPVITSESATNGNIKLRQLYQMTRLVFRWLYLYMYLNKIKPNKICICLKQAQGKFASISYSSSLVKDSFILNIKLKIDSPAMIL